MESSPANYYFGKGGMVALNEADTRAKINITKRIRLIYRNYAYVDTNGRFLTTENTKSVALRFE